MSAPIILTALFAPGDDGWLQEMRRKHFPPERNQVPAHLTLFHHLPPGMEDELSRRIAELVRRTAPRATISGVMSLGRGTAFRVDSVDLQEMREELAEAFHGLLIPQDMAPWRPHITIQNKVEPEEAKALQQELSATFQPRPLAIRALQSWRYLGGPWEPLKTHPFRG